MPGYRTHTSVRATWRASLPLVALALLSGVAAGLVAAEPKTATVRLVVDYGDGVQTHFTALPWREGMTVVDALTAAQKHPRGITFAQRGRGAHALITQIGNLKNDPAGKNWLFGVNGQEADVGAGVYKLKGGDAILWEFKAYD